MGLLKRYPNFFLFSLALTLSGIGSSLSGVAIYELLRQQAAAPESYTLLFALTFLPAFFASELGKRLSLTVKFSSVFIIFNLAGIALCAANLWNLAHQHTWLHYATILFGGIVNGIYFPLYQILLKRTISESDLPALSVYETLIFGLQFILGELLGTLLFSLLGPSRYFQADMLTFLGCTAIVIALANSGRLSFAPLEAAEEGGQKIAPPIRWNRAKRLDFSINIALAAVAAPLMAIMLAHFSKLPMVAIGSLALSPVLIGLSARSLGQLFGPIVGGLVGLDKIAARRFSLEACTALFLSAYLAVFLIQAVLVKALLVLIAHVFSNVVFSIGFYRFNKGFELAEFPVAATRNYQLVTGVMILSAIWAGLVLPIGGELTVVAGAAALFGFISILRHLLEERPSQRRIK